MPEYDDRSIADLRSMRRDLAAEESRVSYWRRIIQARIDLVETGAMRSGATVEGLSRVLREYSGGPRRTAYLPVIPVHDEAPSPELDALWEHVDYDGSSVSVSLAELHDAESRLSAARSELHRRIDEVTGQLIARYREDPVLALSALPRRASHDHEF